MKKHILLFSLLSLSFGCSSTFDKPINTGDLNRVGEQMDITVISHKTTQDLNRSIPNPSEGLRGQAVYSKGDLKCEIHISEEGAPRLSNAYYKLLGHEMAHCLYGDYHD